ncbi:MAG: SpoIIE family protein phosphatase [Elusimicrobia bacterium]|nr:SpoIIE family protein phosphatase [Elusimicrobiota bacterium]MBD3412064.1 SpoIIE family protein phosphatase [Elusimicrobiota bacterium]
MNTLPKVTELFLTLLNNMAILIVVAYVFSRTKLYQQIIEGKITFRNRLYVTLIMGAFSVYGTLSGVNVLGAIANIRNLGPEIAGFIAGPLVGTLTGFIGGIHRYLKGGNTALPCAAATVLSGMFAGFLFLLNKRQFVGLKKATLFAGIFEVFHSGLVLLLGRPFETMLAIELRTTVPRVIVMAAGMAVFSFIMDNLFRERRVRAEKQKIENDLQIASQIQTSMLPRIFPPFPERKEFEIFAMMHPAKEVGGDFYDMFLINENRLCFVIGDVSGKGIPAALFMVICKTLIKTEALRGIPADEVLERVNTTLVPDNDASMFVTVLCMMLDITTGELEIANGGHNPPLVRCANESFDYVKMPKGFVVGPMPGITYMKKTLLLKPGDTVFVYTDGVTEAEDPHRAFYSEGRLKRTLSTLITQDTKSLINGVNADIKTFIKGADQSDDITMLALHYKGGFI